MDAYLNINKNIYVYALDKMEAPDLCERVGGFEKNFVSQLIGECDVDVFKTFVPKNKKMNVMYIASRNEPPFTYFAVSNIAYQDANAVIHKTITLLEKED